MGQNLTPGPPHNGEESACQCRFDPLVRKIPWRSKWQPPSSVLAWAVPWREEPGGLQSMRPQRAGHDCTHRHTQGSRAGGRAVAAREPRGPQLNNQREGWGEGVHFLPHFWKKVTSLSSAPPPGWAVEFSSPYMVKPGLSWHNGNTISDLSIVRVFTWKCDLSINYCFFDVFRGRVLGIMNLLSSLGRM